MFRIIVTVSLDDEFDVLDELIDTHILPFARVVATSGLYECEFVLPILD